MAVRHVEVKTTERIIRCDRECNAGWYQSEMWVGGDLPSRVAKTVGTPCKCGGTITDRTEETVRTVKEWFCSHCDGANPSQDRYSLGIYAGHMCDAAWDKSGYRKDGPEGFDPMDAGESYEADY